MSHNKIYEPNFFIFEKFTDPCPYGYEYRTGTIDRCGTNLTISRNECAMACKETYECISFMHSESKNICCLNEKQEPTNYPHEDFVFCSKIGEEISDIKCQRIIQSNKINFRMRNLICVNNYHFLNR